MPLIDYTQLQLPVARLRFTFQAETPLFLPEYTGSAFRGSFGTAFKKICCAARQRAACSGCAFLEDCAYAYIFETVHSGQSALQAANLPHPFVFEPPLFHGRQTVEPGERLECGMVLVGRALNYLFHFVLVWHEMGRQGLGRQRGKFSLLSVHNEQDQEIYSAADGILKNQPWLRQPPDFVADFIPDVLSLTLSTPLRITEMGKLCQELSFSLLFRNLLRRASLLAEIHTPQKWLLDYSAILQQASCIRTLSSQLRWWDWERYSNRQQGRMQLGGLVGEIRLQGNFALFLPLLRLGEYLHIGKNTSFGMGKYLISP